jgi:hypothetical protein
MTTRTQDTRKKVSERMEQEGLAAEAIPQACCGPAAQSSCCEPVAKAACCGDSQVQGCGCK